VPPDIINTNADMSHDALEVVRVAGWKTKAGAALKRRDEIVAAGGTAIVAFDMPIGWHVKEVAHAF